MTPFDEPTESEFVRINAPRVDKIIAAIEVIEKSAKSNKAEDEMSALLAPIKTRLRVWQAADTTTAIEAAGSPPIARTTAASWFALREAAQTAPLEQLPTVMAVIMNRVDELIHNQPKGK